MKSIAVAISLFLVSTLIFAQSESGRATLEGRVSDASARLVQGAVITAREMSTGFTRAAVTNTEGEFRIGALPVSSYRIEVSAPGFATAIVDHVQLAVGNTKTLSLTLQVPSVSTTVNIEAAADIVNRSDASNSISINSRAIEDLPIRGRNFTEFVQL